MIKKRYTYDESKITATLVDGYFIWVAFQGTLGTSVLYKVSAFDPSTKYYEININADEITKIKADGDYIYLTLDDDDYIAVKLHKTNPLGSQIYYDIPSGIVEKAVDLVLNGYLYILIPGELSGTNAKILRFSKVTAMFNETIDLQKSGEIIRNAKTMCQDDSDNFWIATYEDPIKVVKVFGSPSSWDFTVHEIT